MARVDRQRETLDLDEYPVVGEWLTRWRNQPVGVEPHPVDALTERDVDEEAAWHEPCSTTKDPVLGGYRPCG